MTGTERKVFQKYYPPDFDPSKIPKAKGGHNRQFVQRVMAPFNMQCNTCNEYIYKGKKFNMRRETAEGESYLGMKIFRFYFKCPNCLAEITFKTDMENVDYKGEHGATRLFDAFKTYQEQERAKEAEEEEEKGDAMKMLEKRTKMSKMEMEELGKLEEIQETNRRVERVDALTYLTNTDKTKQLTMAQMLKLQEEEDERTLQKLLGKNAKGRIERRIVDTAHDDNEAPCSSSSVRVPSAPSSTKSHFAPSSTKSHFAPSSTKAPFAPLTKKTVLANGDDDAIFARPANPASPVSAKPSTSVKRPPPPKPEKKIPTFMKGVVIKKAKAS